MGRRVREEILARVVADAEADSAERGERVRRRVARLDADLAAGAVVGPVTAPTDHDAAAWAELLAPFEHDTWLTAPWLVAEFAFYRRLLTELRYFDPADPDFMVDPFARQKAAGLDGCVAAIAALAPKVNGADGSEDALRLVTMVALWGNRMDLSLWPEDGDGERAGAAFAQALAAGAACLLHDDGAAAAREMRAACEAGGRVDLVVDNAGFELATDLALADTLARAGATVVLRVKGHPTFVSDALVRDVHATVDALERHDAPAAARMGRRWRGHVESGRWAVAPDPYWAQGFAFWDMPDRVRAELAGASLVVLKGDANYRRLLGDRPFPLDTPFERVAGYFPAPVLALRTLKAELGCGMAPEGTARAAAADPDDWLVSGKYGVVQLLAAPHGGQPDVAALAGGDDDDDDDELARVLVALAHASREVGGALSRAPLDAAALLGSAGGVNASGDGQKKLDVAADEAFHRALAACGSVAHYASEERDGVEEVRTGAPYAVVCDPLDGSRNIDSGIPTGSIFGVYRALPEGGEASVLQGAANLVAAGYAMYSSATTLVVAVAGGGAPTEFALDGAGDFRAARTLECPARGQVYSLNDARFDDWAPGLQRYVADVRSGKGESGKQYSARYVCALVADLHRTLVDGGWAGNPRPHLRRVFEAGPLAFVTEAAGGAASDGVAPVLAASPPAGLHERAPLFMGSRLDVAELVAYGDVQQGAKQYTV